MATVPASAAEESTGWLTYSWSPYLNGCGMISYLYSNGAETSDAGCSGDVGEKIKYTSGGTTWISGLYYGANYIWVGHANTTAYRVFHK